MPGGTHPNLLGEEDLRSRVQRLAELDRESGGAGEHAAAELIAADLRACGARVELEPARVHGTYWWPIGLTSATALLAALARRRWAAPIAALAAGAAVDDINLGPRLVRRALPQKTTHNVVAEFGDPAAPRTLVFLAHYDAAHSGLVFEPRFPRALMRAFPVLQRAKTTPPTMWGAVYGPLLAAVGLLWRRPSLRRLGALLSGGYLAAMIDIGLRPVVPGANDNATGVVALLSLARALAAEPPPGLRVLLVFPGSEESFMEGMVAWARRHLGRLHDDSTYFVCLDTVGSPRLMLLEGEGMLRIRDYPRELLELVHEVGAQAGVEVLRGLRFRNATDALIPLKAGYPTVMLGSVDEYKLPTDYHWPTDTADRATYSSVADAARLSWGVVRRLASLPSPAGDGRITGSGVSARAGAAP
ncbi:MAG: Zn-dependent exopeptidase M28 [Actinobacteria bacterium]|nr:MAG: Zn-dependent exopeptidase M28 [Actinomycetota bacterium]